jgi:hypothetical protein
VPFGMNHAPENACGILGAAGDGARAGPVQGSTAAYNVAGAATPDGARWAGWFRKGDQDARRH